MVPATYHNNERSVRVCDNCHSNADNFADALRVGDLEKAMSIYSHGNINVHCPFINSEFAVHMAAQGGCLPLFRWLVESLYCPIWEHRGGARGSVIFAGAAFSYKVDGGTPPLRTVQGMSVLAIAAKYAHADILCYLVHTHGSQLAEIQELAFAVRALHLLLEVRPTLVLFKSYFT
jgi:hypothetical protein